ncbi:hypothetical protein NWP17_13395 [Chrysosporum bergii ANA360D]|uniref:Uncharacterized protein n=1 Tax=Chrysosporum bergii ANA360D TaxID=617107 RepID=A0AA43GTE1_9CYAN|nr:hypothetical protein [Chrysosporum bergii]MDH6061419.1 hypothetical protein [Chrysosporum bergii ANA360D]
MNTKSDALLRIKEHQDAILKEFEEMSPTELEELYGTKGSSNKPPTAQPPQQPKPENRVSPGFNAPLPPMAWITDPNANVDKDVYYWNGKMWILG